MRQETSPHFNLSPARRDSAAHHLAALAWTMAAICVGIAVVAVSILVAAS